MEKQKELNSHLAVVFKEILPAIHNAGFKYWVYGGIGVAGVIGKFIRKNNDIDIYVLSTDFDNVRKLLIKLCSNKKDWKCEDARPIKETGRPKLEIKKGIMEICSMVPVYKTEAGIEFRVKNIEVLPLQAIVQELKKIEGYNFFSPPRDIIKTIFRSFIIERPDILNKGSRRICDITAIFTDAEIGEIQKRIK